MRCQDCKFFDEHTDKKFAAAHSAKDGNCWRFPQHWHVFNDHRCGEFLRADAATQLDRIERNTRLTMGFSGENANPQH